MPTPQETRQTLIDTYIIPDTEMIAENHNEVETALNEGIGALEDKLPYNIGFFSGLQVAENDPFKTYTVGGNIASAELQPKVNPSDAYSIIRVTMTNPMDSLEYEVNANVKSEGTFLQDVNVIVGGYRPISVYVFDIVFWQIAAIFANNVRINLTINQK